MEIDIIIDIIISISLGFMIHRIGKIFILKELNSSFPLPRNLSIDH